MSMNMDMNRIRPLSKSKKTNYDANKHSAEKNAFGMCDVPKVGGHGLVPYHSGNQAKRISLYVLVSSVDEDESMPPAAGVGVCYTAAATQLRGAPGTASRC